MPATKESLDYALLVDGKPRVIVEAKAVRQSVADQHAAQCVQYAAVLGVRWCLITNGRQWALYDAYAKVPLADKRIVLVRLDGDEAASDRAWEVLRLFSKEEQTKSNPLTELLIERVVIDELGTPNSRAVEALRQAVRKRFGESVSSAAILSGLKRLLDAGTTPPPVPQHGVQGNKSRGKPTASGSKPGQAKTSGKRISIAELLSAGVLPNDAVLDLRVHGVTHVGQVKDTGIEVNGFLYQSPSAAAGAVTGRASNGWREWTYKGMTLDQLRAKLHSVEAEPQASS